jgi:hypothetical protein
MREATNDTFGKGIGRSAPRTFRPAPLDRLPVCHKLGFSTAFSEELVENQFLTAFIRASLSNGRRRPLFENFSLLALLHDCT